MTQSTMTADVRRHGTLGILLLFMMVGVVVKVTSVVQIITADYHRMLSHQHSIDNQFIRDYTPPPLSAHAKFYPFT
jgi:hypothetical protein